MTQVNISPGFSVFWFLAACSFLSPQVRNGFYRHLVFRSLSLIPHHALKQDLKDLMRKAGEVTFVDAHRPNKNEGYVAFLQVKPLDWLLSSGVHIHFFSVPVEWLSLLPAVT